MNPIAKSLITVAGALLATVAVAQEAASPLSFNVGVVSDYRFRSVSQTSFKPAVQAGVDYAHTSGFYAGAWASNVNWLKDYIGATDGSVEVDVYLGYKGEIVKGLGYDLGAITYQYPGNTTDKILVNANTTEVYAGLSYNVFTLKYSQSVSDFIANPDSKGSRYWDLSANFDLGSGLTLTPHVGRQTIPNQLNDAGDYTDFALTLTKDFGKGITAALTAFSTNTNDSFYKVQGYDNLGKSGVSVGVKYAF
ncbi:MAG: hypothetical protein RIR79_1177 [Pseudomonadota bacterium]|jgi:uncharacterized protein (TIGR02001 family)